MTKKQMQATTKDTIYSEIIKMGNFETLDEIMRMSAIIHGELRMVRVLELFDTQEYNNIYCDFIDKRAIAISNLKRA